jgi:copper chaperone CopZ
VAAPLTQTFDLTKLLSGPYYCSGCAGRVCEGVTELRGAQSAECDLEGGTLTITYDPAEVSPAELEAALARLALEAEGRVAHAAYRITGLD